MKCPKCDTERYTCNKKPQARFQYLPIIPRLQAMFTNSSFARKMRYRANHSHDPTRMTDVFDGSRYRSLLKTFVPMAGEQQPIFFFSDPRDIALGLSTHGFALFKRRKLTSWPIIIFNYNLPPEERFKKTHIISCGTIPGPNKPWDMDSFLWPLIQELVQLEIGVSAFDVLSETHFRLHAYLILVFGDIPAISMVMRMKGHNALLPCRVCEIIGVRIPSSRATTHYVPLSRVNFPDTDSPREYNPDELPLRSHAIFMQQAEEVQSANIDAESTRLAKKYGIKGIPLLSCLSSISFPLSFPYDFMHLIWSNLLPNLTLLWCGSFKDIDHSDHDYVLLPTVWEAIGEATAAAGKTIPAAFGSRVPNISSSRSEMIAETYAIWTLFLAPVLLKGRFVNQRYYKHFIDLVQLLTLCLEFEIESCQIDELERGFSKWVQEYERYLLLPYLQLY